MHAWLSRFTCEYGERNIHRQGKINPAQDKQYIYVLSENTAILNITDVLRPGQSELAMTSQYSYNHIID